MLGTTNTSAAQASMNNLSISINGTNKLTYNGKTAASLDITLASIGAAASNHDHNIMSFNNNSLNDATYGLYWGVIQNDSADSTKDWFNRIKILHSNSEGYYTELAQSFTGEERLQHRRLRAGVLSSWKTVLDSANYGKYALPLSGGRMSNTNVVANLNADMVDYSHAWQMQTLAQNGGQHGTGHQIICQYNVNGDGRFFFRKEDNGHEISTHHSLYSNNTGALAGLPWTSYVTSPFYGESNGGWMGVSNPNHAMIGDCNGTEASTPTGGWCHFISLPHRSMNHHTAQIIIPFFNRPELYVRTAPGGVADNLGNICRFYSSYNSNPCTITPNGPGGEYLWCW